MLAAVSSFGQPIAGLVIDRLGPHRLAILSAIATSATLASVPMLPTFGLLVAVAAVGGAAAAVYHPAAAALVRSNAGSTSSASALGLFAAGGTLGLAAGPTLATTLATHSAVLTSVVLALPGLTMAVVTAATVEVDPASDVRNSHRAPRSAPRARVQLPMLVATMAAIYVGSITVTTAVPLWLADHGAAAAIGPTLGVFSLAAAGGGMLGARIASTRHPSATAHAMLATPASVLALPHLVPGSLGWYAVVATGGALAHLVVPVALDAAQRRLHGAVAAASGLVMGLPIGVASVVYLTASLAIETITIGHVATIAAGSTAIAAVLAHLAFAPERTPRPTRTPACTCTGGALAIATC